MAKLGTKRRDCWEFIKKHGSITRWDAIRITNYTNLPDYIYKLKAKGIDVRSVEERDDDGHWTRYYIDAEEMKRAEEAHLVNV